MAGRGSRPSWRRGWAVNHKRVYRIMREDNLLCLRRRKFVVTTDSNHGLPVYPNLARELTLTGIDQLWVADITYIRLELEFVYLAVILDAFSRRVIGWALDRTLEDELTIAGAADGAGAAASRRPGLVHHSDRGVQYAARDYTDLLKDHGIQISMRRKGNPYDNARLRIVHEDAEIRGGVSAGIPRSGRSPGRIGMFLEKVYNQKRLHSALGYRPPVEFERGLLAQNQKEAAARHVFLMSFLRHEEIYPFDEGAAPQDHALPHRTMSFRLAIPWRVALQQCPPPLHQPSAILQDSPFAVQSNSSGRQTVS